MLRIDTKPGRTEYKAYTDATDTIWNIIITSKVSVRAIEKLNRIYRACIERYEQVASGPVWKKKQDE